VPMNWSESNRIRLITSRHVAFVTPRWHTEYLECVRRGFVARQLCRKISIPQVRNRDYKFLNSTLRDTAERSENAAEFVKAPTS